MLLGLPRAVHAQFHHGSDRPWKSGCNRRVRTIGICWLVHSADEVKGALPPDGNLIESIWINHFLGHSLSLSIIFPCWSRFRKVGDELTIEVHEEWASWTNSGMWFHSSQWISQSWWTLMDNIWTYGNLGTQFTSRRFQRYNEVHEVYMQLTCRIISVFKIWKFFNWRISDKICESNFNWLDSSLDSVHMCFNPARWARRTISWMLCGQNALSCNDRPRAERNLDPFEQDDGIRWLTISQTIKRPHPFYILP